MSTTRMDRVAAGDEESFDTQVVVPERGTGPGVLLLQEIFGVNEFLLAKAADLADLGYVVSCPDVFWRVERGVSLAHDEAAMESAFGYAQRFGAIAPEVTARDLLGALAHLRQVGEVEGRPVGVMGYCLGGRLAYEVAVAGDPDTCVSYYGSGIADRLEDAGRIGCPVIFHFGGADPYLPQDQVGRIGEAFAHRDDVEVHVQAGAGHAFENFLAPQFSNPAAAAVSWPLTVDFLARTLQP